MLESRHFHVFGLEHGFGIDVISLLGIEEGAVFQADVVYHLYCAMGRNGRLAVAAHHTADLDIAELGQEFLAGGLTSRGAHGIVGIGGFEGDGLALDVVHEDVADEDAAGLAPTAGAALEAQPRVGARKGVARCCACRRRTRSR